MNFDITWTITAIIAVSSFLSPIVVAIINNFHQARIRQIELEHDRHIRLLDIQHQASIRQLDIYYADKKNAFQDFAKCAGALSFSSNLPSHYTALHSSIDIALLFCCPENQEKLRDFMNFVETESFGNKSTQKDRIIYSQHLNDVLLALNRELESAKPIMQCK